MFKPLELLTNTGETEIINLSQIVKTFDNETEEHGADGKPVIVTVLQFSNGDSTILKGEEREKYIAIENVHKEAVKMEAWTFAQQIEAAARSAAEQAKNAPGKPTT